MNIFEEIAKALGCDDDKARLMLDGKVTPPTTFEGYPAVKLMGIRTNVDLKLNETTDFESGVKVDQLASRR